jgi:hypothetical protein
LRVQEDARQHPEGDCGTEEKIAIAVICSARLPSFQLRSGFPAFRLSGSSY